MKNLIFKFALFYTLITLKTFTVFGQTISCPPTTDFNLTTPCYVNGSRAANPNEDVIVLWNHATARGTAATKQVLANYSEVGTVWGMAWKAQTKKLYAAAFLKRHCDLSPDGLGAIYEIDLTTPTTAGAGTPTLWLNLNSTTHLGAGATLFPTETAANRELAANVSPNHDVWAFDKVGKEGLGDIDISVDGKTMYVVDLTNRQVLVIDMATKTVSNRYPVPAPSNYTNAADRRPFAVKYHKGELYVGVVSSGETGEVTANLRGTIMKLTAGAFTPVLDLPNWTYRDWPNTTKLGWYAYYPTHKATFPTLYPDGYYISYSVPLISDIEFDNNNNMIIGVMDWSGHRYGNANYAPTTNTLYSVQGLGDIIKATASGATWTVESPVGQFYKGMTAIDPPSTTTWPQDTFMGGLIVSDCSGTELVANNMQDPFVTKEGGVVWMKTSDGTMETGAATTSRMRVYYDISGGSSTLGKASGLGDMVSTFAVICTPINSLTASATPNSMATGATSALATSATSGIISGTTTFAWAGTGGFTASTQNPSTGALATAGGYLYTVTATNTDGSGTCTATATTSLTVSTAVCGASFTYPNFKTLGWQSSPLSCGVTNTNTAQTFSNWLGTGVNVTFKYSTNMWDGDSPNIYLGTNDPGGCDNLFTIGLNDLQCATNYQGALRITNNNQASGQTFLDMEFDKPVALNLMRLGSISQLSGVNYEWAHVIAYDASNTIVPITPAEATGGYQNCSNVITNGQMNFISDGSGGIYVNSNAIVSQSSSLYGHADIVLPTTKAISKIRLEHWLSPNNTNPVSRVASYASMSLNSLCITPLCTTLSGLTATATPNTFSTGGNTALNVTGTGITAGTTTFSWAASAGSPSFSSSTIQNPTISNFTVANGYYYTVTATNANGTGVCTATATTSLTVTPSAVFDLALKKELVPATPKNPSLVVGGTVTFRISISNQGGINATNIQITDYVPTGLTLNDANWTVVAGKATLNTPIASLATGTTTTRDITFTIGNVLGSIRNFAEISAATGGTDVDSTPDADNTNDGTPKDDITNEDHKSTTTADEDDHDYEDITVGCSAPTCAGISVLRVR